MFGLPVKERFDEEKNMLYSHADLVQRDCLFVKLGKRKNYTNIVSNFFKKLYIVRIKYFFENRFHKIYETGYFNRKEFVERIVILF